MTQLTRQLYVAEGPFEVFMNVVFVFVSAVTESHWNEMSMGE
jgi:hypothetical protein